MFKIHLKDATDPHSDVTAVIDHHGNVKYQDPDVARCVHFVLSYGQHHFALEVGSHTFMCYMADQTLGGLCDPD